MATTDNIGHTPCRTTTPPFGHFLSPMPERKADEVKKKKKKNKSHGREADGGSIGEGFPRSHPPHLRVIQSRHPIFAHFGFPTVSLTGFLFFLFFLTFSARFLYSSVSSRFAPRFRSARDRSHSNSHLRFTRLSHHLRASHARTSL